MNAHFTIMGITKNPFGEYEKVLELHQRAGRALQAKGVNDSHPDVAHKKMNIAFIYTNQVRWSEAENTLNAAKRIFEHILPEAHPDIAHILFSIGVVLRSQQRYKDALAHMKQALAIYMKNHINKYIHTLQILIIP